jgi:hypothetical protein
MTGMREAIASARFAEFRDQTAAQWAQGDLPVVEAGLCLPDRLAKASP